jgi:hypothetical protein
MDSKRFDRVAKSLAQAGTRRSLMSGSLGAAVLTALGLSGETLGKKQVTAEHCLAVGETCPKTLKHGRKQAKHSCARRCCTRYSVSAANGTRRCACVPPGQPCTAGTARQCCSGVCDGNVCAPGTAPGCGAGLTNCGGICRDLLTDEDNCGGCGTRCSGGRACIGGTCQATCAAYGASACQTPTTVCGPDVVTCGGNPNCFALPTTSGCCACSNGAGPSHQTCTSNRDCLSAAVCGPDDSCNGDRDLPCRTDADCASLLRCRDGACGGQICTTDADCEALLGPGTVCISGAALPCTAGGANICWTLCTGA